MVQTEELRFEQERRLEPESRLGLLKAQGIGARLREKEASALLADGDTEARGGKDYRGTEGTAVQSGDRLSCLPACLPAVPPTHSGPEVEWQTLLWLSPAASAASGQGRGETKPFPLFLGEGAQQLGGSLPRPPPQNLTLSQQTTSHAATL